MHVAVAKFQYYPCLEMFLSDCCIRCRITWMTVSALRLLVTVLCHTINSLWHSCCIKSPTLIENMTSNQSDAASGSNHCLFECSWMQCCQQNHVRSVYARPRVIPMSWTPLCGRLEVNLCRATSVSVVSSTLDYNNRKTLIIIIINSNYYYYYYKNNNNNDHFIHSHFTEVKIKRVSAQCWAVVWVPQG